VRKEKNTKNKTVPWSRSRTSSVNYNTKKRHAFFARKRVTHLEDDRKKRDAPWRRKKKRPASWEPQKKRHASWKLGRESRISKAKKKRHASQKQKKASRISNKTKSVTHPEKVGKSVCLFKRICDSSCRCRTPPYVFFEGESKKLRKSDHHVGDHYYSRISERWILCIAQTWTFLGAPPLILLWADDVGRIQLRKKKVGKNMKPNRHAWAHTHSRTLKIQTNKQSQYSVNLEGYRAFTSISVRSLISGVSSRENEKIVKRRKRV